MRIQLLILIVFLLGLGSCKDTKFNLTKTSTKVEISIIDGKKDHILTLEGEKVVYVSSNPDGKFLIDTAISQQSILYVVFEQARIPLFLSPGDDIKMTLDAKQYQGAAKYTGSHALENAFLKEFEEFKRSQEPKDYYAFYTADEEDFLINVEQKIDTFNTFQQDFQSKNGTFTSDFAETFQKIMDYESAVMKMNYPQYYKFFNKDSQLVLSENYESFFQNIVIDDQDKMGLPAYRNFINQYIQYNVEKDTSAASKLALSYDHIKKSFKSDRITSFLYYQTTKAAIESSPNDFTPLLSDYTSLQTNERYIEEINTDYNRLKPILKGNPAPDFAYSDIKGNIIKLSSLRGKVVYIDVWATWCGPCLQELPYLEKVQISFAKEKDIKFVSVSIDPDKSDWSRMVKAKSMKGIQLLADKDWKSQIVEDYHIKGIPRFIIIGKDGNIIDANAVRPSNDKLVNMLTKALES